MRIRVELPTHLRTLARVDHEVEVDANAATVCAVIDALEQTYPVLRGTIRDHTTHERRAFIRFFACQEDVSLNPQDTPLPDAVARGEEPLIVVGAVAGG